MSEENDITVKQPETEADLIRGLLDQIVPPDSIEIQDLYGNSYTLKSRVSARSQIKIGREFEKAIDGLSVSEILDGESLGIQGIISAFIKIASEDKVLKGIDKCFQIAHHGPYKKTLAIAKKDEDMPKNPTAIDFFALEDILGGVLPLFLGLLRKGAGILTAISANQE